MRLQHDTPRVYDTFILEQLIRDHRAGANPRVAMRFWPALAEACGLPLSEAHARELKVKTTIVSGQKCGRMNDILAAAAAVVDEHEARPNRRAAAVARARAARKPRVPRKPRAAGAEAQTGP